MDINGRLWHVRAASSAALGALSMVATSSLHAEITNAPQPPGKSAYKVEIVARGLDYPWGMQFLPDGRMLVTERPGRLRIVSRDGKLSAPVSGVPGVHARDQGGLLDVAIAPDFTVSGTVYLSFSERRDGFSNGTSVLRAKLVMDGAGGKLEGGTVIFRQLPAIQGGHHYGSRIVVNADGSLFVTLGERYSQREQAQNPANHLGKIVRIEPDGAAYRSNPKLPGWAPEVWSIGHRNVQGAALDPATGQLWTTEHGAMGGDELNHPEAGKNYGWPVITYGRDYSGAKIGIGTAKEGLEQPVYYWDPSIATSGLAFYTGDLFPAWKGNAFAGGLAGMQIARLVLKDGKVVAEEKLLSDRGWRIRDVRNGPDGALWALTDEPNGMILRIAP
jgi:aldose sugar dehydrogenase